MMKAIGRIMMIISLCMCASLQTFAQADKAEQYLREAQRYNEQAEQYERDAQRYTEKANEYTRQAELGQGSPRQGKNENALGRRGYEKK